jgi:DNA transformation protein
MSEYVEYLKEVFSEFGSVEPRRMFEGYGIFYKGLMLGLEPHLF